MDDDLQETGNALKISLMMLKGRKSLVLLPLITIQARPVFLSIFEIFSISLPKGPKLNTGQLGRFCVLLVKYQKSFTPSISYERKFTFQTP